MDLVPSAARSMLALVLALGCSANGDSPLATGSLVAAVPMSANRAAHTATTLADGRVLVAGGFTEKGSAKGAELYEPEAGRFAPLPAMVATRHSHTATLLPDGQVLLAGGYGEGTVTLASAELFDPGARAFAPTGALAARRAGHVAVPLRDGKVLIAGGLGPDWTFLDSAELFDPATGSFSPTGSMTTARESHVAVRLPDGRVLVVGGHQGRRRDLTLLASAEIFDPSTGSFRRTGDLRIRRHKHDAVLLADGRVLVTGGSDERDDRGVYVSTELFDPHSETFAPGPDLRDGRYKHPGTSLALPDGRVLLAGGAAGAELFDPRANRFARVPGAAPLAGSFSAAALLPDGGVLITGGYGNGGGPRSSAWLYRP